MNANYTAVLKQEGTWWIGWIEEVPGVNCQEASRDKLLDTLAVTLREVLDLNRSDAIDAAGESYEEFEIVLYSSEFSRTYTGLKSNTISCRESRSR